MSKWVKDPEIQKDLQGRISKIEMTRKEVSGGYFEQIMPKVIAHYKEHVNDDQVFYEGKAAFVLIKTFEKPDVMPESKLNEFSGNWERRLPCAWKLGIMGIFATDDQWAQIGWKASSWVRGKLGIKFDLMGFEQKYYKTIEIACKKNGVDIDTIDEADILRSYTLNMWQVVE